MNEYQQQISALAAAITEDDSLSRDARINVLSSMVLEAQHRIRVLRTVGLAQAALRSLNQVKDSEQ